MAEAHSDTIIAQSTTTTARRGSFRKNLQDLELPSQCLEALEQKRRALDDSIHKYIASKEREYKQYEKELRHKAKRLSGEGQSDVVVDQIGTVAAAGDLHKSPTLSDVQRANITSAPMQEEGAKRKSKKGDDFPGVFTPEYLSALDHATSDRSLSEPPTTSNITVVANGTILRTNSDTAAIDTRPTRSLLSQRTSSSGSSVDGKLVSALKSVATASDVSKIKRKRVSLAVGDAIVAPSDSVPVALNTYSSSSHSRPKTPARERTSFLDAPSPSHDIAVEEEKSAGSFETKDDVGDMFDLEESDGEQSHENIIDESDDFNDDNEVAGRVHPVALTEQDTFGLKPKDIEPGEPPPSEDETMPISYTERPQSIREPGFRRPSVSSDPIYAGRNYNRAEEGAEESGLYSSSFSRPANKGSFTSGSLGESFMARNAEKMMEMRAQQRDASRSGTERVLPVR